MHGNHVISQEELPKWKSGINNTTFKVKLMKIIFLILWDILLSKLKPSTNYHSPKPWTLTGVQELLRLMSQHTDTSILAAKSTSAYTHGEH